MKQYLNRRRFLETTAAGIGALSLTAIGRGEEVLASCRAPADAGESTPLAFVPGSFTVAVLPDTQFYCEKFPHHYYNQTRWIVDNAERYNIKQVLHLGDITNRNLPDQWQVARQAMATLDGKVPYALVPGNHDYTGGGHAPNRQTLLNEHFSFADHSKQSGFGGALDDGKLENTFHTFRGGDHDYLVIALEWGPRDRAVEWADKIVTDHPNHRAILITHAYMYCDDTRYDWQTFREKQHWNPHGYLSDAAGGVNDGEQLWQKLVSKHPNFILTFNGHVCHDGLGLMSSKGAGAHQVHQMLVNYQMKKEGGEGYLRLVEFLPGDQQLQIKAYSPSLDKFKIDSQNQFTLQRSMS